MHWQVGEGVLYLGGQLSPVVNCGEASTTGATWGAGVIVTISEGPESCDAIARTGSGLFGCDIDFNGRF